MAKGMLITPVAMQKDLSCDTTYTHKSASYQKEALVGQRLFSTNGESTS